MKQKRIPKWKRLGFNSYLDFMRNRSKKYPLMVVDPIMQEHLMLHDAFKKNEIDPMSRVMLVYDELMKADPTVGNLKLIGRWEHPMS